MKVVFLEDIPNVAKAGDTKEIADGYGRNYLLPRKLAVLANSEATNILEAQMKKRVRIQAQTEAEMRELEQQLEGTEIVIKARVGTSDRLYGSVTSADIVEEINNSYGLVVDKRKIELEEPIRQTGSYEINIRLTGDIIPKLKLTVEAEAEDKPSAETEMKKEIEKEEKPEVIEEPVAEAEPVTEAEEKEEKG